MSLNTARVRTSVVAVAVAGSLLALPACSSSKTSNNVSGGQTTTATSSAEAVKFAKTKFVANAALASGAFYQWIYKPFKAGTFKSGAQGRTAALVKGGLAGAFTYNRLKAALNDAKADPTLSKATAALSAAVAGLKDLPSKIKGGTASDADVNQFSSVIDNLKSTAASNGLNIQDQVPSASQLTQMVTS